MSETEPALALCAACAAFRGDASLEEAREAVTRLQQQGQLVVRSAECAACGRHCDVAARAKAV